MILGVDPGGSTGLALIDAVKMSLEFVGKLPIEEFYEHIPNLVSQAGAVGIERFTIGPQTLRHSRQPEAMYAIGATLAECHRQDVMVDIQTPADAKRSFPDHVLKELGVWDKNEHIRDAIRHALLCARRRGPMPVHDRV